MTNLSMEFILILIGIGLLIGAFYSSWLLWKLIEDIEKKKKNK
ncbi:MAG TPA: hypothetical protein VMR41_04190 [Patescibacteria group bacterium]|nr:hypothetical protein [Patescibacteria group bacterium]